MTETVVLVVTLNSEQLCLQRGAVVAQNCLQGGLERDTKLDRLASKYHDSSPAVGVARSRKTLPCATDSHGCEITPSSYHWLTASGVSAGRGFRNRKRKRRTLTKRFNRRCSEKDAIFALKIDTRTSAFALGQDGSGHAAMLNIGSKQQSTNISKQDGRVQAAVLKTETNTPSTNISGQDGEEEAAVLGTESVQPLTRNTFARKECVHTLPLCPISGKTSNAPDKHGSELTTSLSSPSCVSHTCQDKSVSKEDFMALLCLSPTSVVARVRRCNRHAVSKDLHIKLRKIWRKISGEGNISYSGLMAKAVLRSSKLRVSLERNNLIDRLALQPVPQAIDIKNLESLRTRTPKAANQRKRLVDLCNWKPSSVNVVLKRDSDLDRLALPISNVRSTSVSSDTPGKSTVNPITSPLSTGNTSSLTSEKPGCKWLSVDIKRDSGLDMLAKQTSDSMCESPPSPGMSNITPGKVEIKVTVPLSTGASTCKAPRRPGCEWLSVDIIRDSCLDALAQQTSHSTSNSSGTCNISPGDPKRTGTVTLSSDSVRKSGSGLDVLAHKTTNSPFESLSSNSPEISAIVSSDDNRPSTVQPSTSPFHVIENPGLKNLRIIMTKDSYIDQLALQTSNASIIDSGSDCSHSSVAHQPTPKFPLASDVSPLKNPREGTKNPMNCRGKLKLLPNIEVTNDSEILAPRTGVIKLRRLMSDDWSIVQPDEQGCPSSSESGATKSTDSKNSTVELSRNPRVRRLAQPPTSRSTTSGSGFSRKSRSHDNQWNVSAVPPEQTKARTIFHSKRSFKDAPKTIPSGFCSDSPKRRTRSVNESPLEWHYNENENPRQRDIPLVKTINVQEKHFPAGVEKRQALRRSCCKILENDSLEERRIEGKAARLKVHSNDYNPVKPSISSCMFVKKPLAVKSPNHESTC